MRLLFTGFLLFIFSLSGFSQLYYKGTLKENRDKLYRNLVQNTITKNLSIPLTDSSYDEWLGAFNAMEVLRYQSPWINSRIDTAAEQMNRLPVSFQRATLELLYSNYPEKYYQQVKFLFKQTTDAKILAMCAVYILNSSHAKDDINFLIVITKQSLALQPENPILQQLLFQLSTYGKSFNPVSFNGLLSKDYLKGQVLVISFQRKNRDYPGIVMVRDANGNFIKDSTGIYFSVPQLARSITNLPAYLTNGNTPEGIYRLKGYDVSRSNFIGPTVNVQLTMPFERKAGHFYNNNAMADTIWKIEDYKKLLPAELKEYYPMHQSFYAGKAGRTEIIIHGTTVNPEYYFSQPYYPLTPTLGCLTSKEIWNEETGQRTESDQQKLINAMIKAGGANGYAIVINIDDAQKPVSLYEILPQLEKAQGK